MASLWWGGVMYGAVIHAPGDVRYEEREDPTIIESTDAIVRTVAACVCGSDLWRYRGISPVPKPTPIGHEFCGAVEAVGEAVTSVKESLIEKFSLGSILMLKPLEEAIPARYC